MSGGSALGTMDRKQRKYEFFLALSRGDLSSIQDSVRDLGANINLCPTNCCQALFETYLFAQESELLLNPSFSAHSFDDVDSISTHVGIHPIHIACGRGHVSAVEYLAAICSNLDIQTPATRISPLHAAMLCRKSSQVIADMCALLVRHGARLDIRHDVYATPFHHGVLLRSPAIINSLLTSPVQFADKVSALRIVDTSGETPLNTAVNQRSADCVAALVDAGAEVNECNISGRLPLLQAVFNEDLETLKALLTSLNCDVNDVGTSRITCLAYAVHLGNEQLVDTLLRAGADSERCCDLSPLMSAACSGRDSVARMLIKAGASVQRSDQSGSTALHYAARQGKVEMIQMLLDNGASDECRTIDGRTPLAVACHGGQTMVAAMFIERNCNVNSADIGRDTPLSYCAFNGDLDACRLLIEHGAIIDVKNHADATPLWNASYGGHAQVLKYLIDAGSSVISIKSRGVHHHRGGLQAPYIYDVQHTPLYVAVHRQHMEIIKLLLSRGLEMRDERWYWNQRHHPVNAATELMTLVDEAARNVPSLMMLIRSRLRRLLGAGFFSSVTRLEIPILLKQFLTE